MVEHLSIVWKVRSSIPYKRRNKNGTSGFLACHSALSGQKCFRLTGTIYSGHVKEADGSVDIRVAYRNRVHLHPSFTVNSSLSHRYGS